MDAAAWWPVELVDRDDRAFLYEERLIRLSSIGRGLRVGRSGIAAAGNGLFATRPFAANEWITWYEGEDVDRDVVMAMRANQTATHLITRGVRLDLIDGIRSSDAVLGSGAASLANDARDDRYTNSKFVTDTPNVYLRATKPIAAGEEIFVSYGLDYWALHELYAK